MRNRYIGHGPGLAAPHAASSGGTAGAASVAAAALGPGRLNSQKETALAAQAAQSREQNEHPNFAIDASADKAFLTLRAHLALNSYALYRTADSDGPVRFFVTHIGLAHELRDLAAGARFLDQVGGVNA